MGVKEVLHQGDIIKIEKVKHPVLVVSKDFFKKREKLLGVLFLPVGNQERFI